MKKILSLVAGLGMVALIVGTSFVAQNVSAVNTDTDPINVCHKTGPSWNYLDTPDQTAHDSHIAHGDFDYAGPTDVSENDKDAWCQANVPANIPPVANAGPDQTITLPTNSVNLNGTGTDTDGTIASYVWTQTSGPSVVNPNDVEDPTASPLVAGVYVFGLVVTDDDGAVSSQDTVQITVNTAPVENTLPLCTDGIDNDGDQLIDLADPDCAAFIPKLTVTKVVTGGTLAVGNFSLFVDTTSVTSGVQNTYSVGAHTVSETAVANYTGVVSGDCALSGSVTLAAGDTKACTITNTFVPPPTPPECDDGVDNGDQEDTLADELDPGCWTDPNLSSTYDANDNDETDPTDLCSNDSGIQTNVEQCTPPPTPPQCDDDINNDGEEDALIDYPADPGCTSLEDDSESPNPREETSTVSGMKWSDVNSDRQTEGESGIAGWSINLFEYSVIDDAIVIEETPLSTTTTDGSGNYSFVNLDPDLNYVVCEVSQGGWEQTSPIIQSDGTVNCANGTVGYIAQSSGEGADDFTFKNFGNHETPQCSDTQNNDSDELIDANDPGCHTDGNVTNSESYDPSDNDETDVVVDQPSNNSSSGSRPSRGGVLGVTSPIGEVLGAADEICTAVNSYMRRGYKNNSVEVLKVQGFLNAYMKHTLVLDGLYGPLTEASVKSFQVARKDNVLTPWRLTAPTGIFYKTSLAEAKRLMCPDQFGNLPIPTDLIPWSANARQVPAHL